MAASGVKCAGVFNGKTPADPITKVADKTTAYAGQTVTFTVGFHATGVSTADVRDCYRVDGGKNATLNALVTGFNAVVNHTNVGGKGAAQTVTFTITIPSDASLVGHSIQDRAKITHGSTESRSVVISVSIVAPPVQGCTSNCGGTTGCTSNCGGTTGCTSNCGGTTGGGTAVQGKQIHKKTAVKGGQLAHTGPVSAKAAFLGSLMVMVGLVTRIRRPKLATPMVETADNTGSSYLARYDSYLQAALKHRA
jgi:hypothetical protein